jgi:hypothetical protein
VSKGASAGFSRLADCYQFKAAEII